MKRYTVTIKLKNQSFTFNHAYVGESKDIFCVAKKKAKEIWGTDYQVSITVKER